MIYENIKRLADENDMTIQEIEKKCNLSNGIIAKWRENSNPKVQHLKAVAVMFNVTVDELLKEGVS